MRWTKKGLIFVPDGTSDWMVSHAQIPFADKINDNILRIYFATRDKQGRSQPAFIEVEADSPENILYIHDRPILPFGKPGTFDDNGIMPFWIVNHQNLKYLYYVGWTPQVTTSYRLGIGLAISEDDGKTYHKYSEAPILDRSLDEPYFVMAPCLLLEEGIWKMWYSCVTHWETINGWPEPHYLIKYAESFDGVYWTKIGNVCIGYDEFTNAIGRPCVIKDSGIYKMFYSYRSAINYRKDPNQSYRLGYAESRDGIDWARKDQEIGIGKSESGWDSEMINYAHIYEHKGKKHMIYNGNGFGRTGFGYAVLDLQE
jgi:hypothetical protein